MSKPVAWILGLTLIIAGPLIGIALRRVVDRIAAKTLVASTTPGSQTARRLVLGLAHDLAVPVCALVALAVALDLPGGIPFPMEIIHQVLKGALMVAITFAIARLAADVVTSVIRRISGISGSVSLFATITRVLIYAVGALITLDSVGIRVTPLLGALGVGALAIALALEGTLANLFAGVHILASRTVQPGDFVRLDTGEVGWITDVNWRTTSIREIPGNVVIVPNRKFADAILTNFNHPAQDMAIAVEVSTSYDSDLDQVERVTLEVARQVMCELDVGVPDAEPRVRFHTFGDSGIGFRVVLRTRQYEDQYLLVSEFIKALHRRFRMEGIVIPYPIRVLHTAPITEPRTVPLVDPSPLETALRTP
ncbi:mechanosensitive ion channel family protein [Nocardia otitidiscaviarum]|uniref:mechanosensitive ion channel family protein n=1 Tax=Nocardia otitidiscaviarum TaxID=1823 RepID=UPI001895A3F1|nr:mechanosensitive ion channel family protein [Nocardia otitidiscaviarum]MBF6181004.1 mechanosensitive ion channel family protein [Nocardia otitidiscaviarum]